VSSEIYGAGESLFLIQSPKGYVKHGHLYKCRECGEDFKSVDAGMRHVNARHGTRVGYNNRPPTFRSIL
jgi:hypothetical protein